MGVFGRGILYLFKDFSCWTSTHGIPHIGMANALWLRLLWCLVVAGCIVGFLVQLQFLVTKYFAFNVNTNTKLEFSDRPFPVITVCHLNPWKRSAAEQSDYLNGMMLAYPAAMESSDYGFALERNGARQQRAQRLTTMAAEHMFALSTAAAENATYEDPAYSYSDLVVSCTYNALTCNASDFDTMDDATYGRCIVFNNLDLAVAKKSSRAGPLYGLRLIMRTDQAEYLPWTDSSGVVVAIHNKTDPAFPDVFGFYAPPGTASSLGLRYVTTTRLPTPYGDCINVQEVKLAHYRGEYSAEACYRSCLQEEIIRRCSCYYPGFDFYGNASTPSCFFENDCIATSNNLNCVDGVTASTATDGYDLMTNCDCKQTCGVQTYSVTVSTAQWPSNEYTPNECNTANQVGAAWMEGAAAGVKKNRTACVNWYKKNTLLLEIFYERMNFQVLSESPAYSFMSLVSDIGGQVGLFLGMSIISIFEFATLLMLLVFYVCSHRARRAEIAAIEEEIARAERENEELQRAEEEREARRRAARMKAMYEDEEDGVDVVPPAVADS